MPSVDDKASPDSKFNPLSAEETRVILGKGTERAFTGEYTDSEGPRHLRLPALQRAALSLRG